MFKQSLDRSLGWRVRLMSSHRCPPPDSFVDSWEAQRQTPWGVGKKWVLALHPPHADALWEAAAYLGAGPWPWASPWARALCQESHIGFPRK